jgi:hypothetical protein
MPAKRSKKRERQYDHIKESSLESDKSTKRAKKIAAATVDKQREEAGETVTKQKRDKARHIKRKSRVQPLTKQSGSGRGRHRKTKAKAKKQ